jgi:DNA-binding Lrp family transcriptional regulator
MTGPPLSTLDKRIIFHLSGDLDHSARPYAALADKLGLTEDEVLEAVRRFQAQGWIRRFGAILGHQKSGFKANAMVAWLVKPEEIEAKGERLAGLAYVSHCYQRRTAPNWPFNLYTMIHAESQERLGVFLAEMTEICRASDWQVLESLQEFKITCLRFFHEDGEPTNDEKTHPDRAGTLPGPGGPGL